MTNIAPTEHEEHDEGEHDAHTSLRGSFVAVLVMSVFFLATWFTLFAIAMERR